MGTAPGDLQLGGSPTVTNGTNGLSFYWNDTTKLFTAGTNVAASAPTVSNGTNILLYCWNDTTKKWTACSESSGGVGFSTFPSGSLLMASTTAKNTWTYLATSTNGYILKINATGTPEWVATSTLGITATIPANTYDIYGQATNTAMYFQSVASTTFATTSHAHWGVYDTYGQATSTLASHTSTYNHVNYNTAYDNASTSPFTNFVKRNDWTSIDNYPAACSQGVVTAVGDTLTCTATGTLGITATIPTQPWGATTTGFIYYNGGTPQVGIGTTTTATGQLLTLASTTNTYLDAGIQNFSAGANAEANLYVANNKSNSTSYFGLFGINSSAYAQPAYNLTGFNDVYLMSSDGNLVLNATSTTAASSSIKFGTGGTTSNQLRMVINGNGEISIGTSTANGLFSIGSSTNNQFRVNNSGSTTFQRFDAATTTATSTIGGGLNILGTIYSAIARFLALFIPYGGANLTNNGQVKVATSTWNSLNYYASSSEWAIQPGSFWGTTYASSSALLAGFNNSGTSSVRFISDPWPTTCFYMGCMASSSGSFQFELADVSGNQIKTLNCGTTWTSTTSFSHSSNAEEGITFRFGTKSGNPDQLIWKVGRRPTP